MGNPGHRGTDLTSGSIYRALIRFTLPIAMGQFLQNLYNSVDAIVVGKLVGHTALAAVTSCGDIAMLLTGFFSGFAVGTGVVLSKYYGAKDREMLQRAVHTALLFSILLGAVMATLGIVFTPQLLRLIECPADVFSEALHYLRIYLAGIFFTAFYNVGAGVLQAVGDSRTPLRYLTIAGSANIVFDVIFVAGLEMGVAGAAWATVLSQALSVYLVLRNLMGAQEDYRVQIKCLRIDGALLREIIRLGIPAAVQACLIALSNLFVQRYINRFGSAAMAGMGAAKKIDRLVGMTAQSVGLASTTFVSQNLGAGKVSRVRESIRKSIIVGGIAVIAISIPVYCLAPWLAALFTDNEEAIGYAVGMMRIIVPTYLGLLVDQILSNTVRGYGRSIQAMILSMLGLIGCRQVFLFVSMHLIPCAENIYWAYPVGWTSSMLMLAAYYFGKVRKQTTFSA